MSYSDYYPEDFYNEPSEFEEKVDELKETLALSIKDEWIYKMKRLTDENHELQEVKKNFEKIKYDYKQKEMALEHERQDLERKIRKERLSELLKDNQIEYYAVANKYKSKPKCDKCDENRRIYYITPLGKNTYENCDCAGSFTIYEPIPTMLSEFNIREGGKANAWYKIKDKDSRYEHLSYYEDSINGDKLITSEENFEDIRAYDALFATKELAQKFCDYRNREALNGQ